MLWKVTFYKCSMTLRNERPSTYMLHRGLHWSGKVRERARNRIQISLIFLPTHCASRAGFQASEGKGCNTPSLVGNKADGQPHPPVASWGHSAKKYFSHISEDEAKFQSLRDPEKAWAPPFQYWQPSRRVFCRMLRPTSWMVLCKTARVGLTEVPPLTLELWPFVSREAHRLPQ